MTQTVLGNVPSDQTPTGADTVERVVERVVSSSLLEDRRDGCRALRALARKYRLLVGAHAMDALLQALETDRSDHELVNCALETLIAITSPQPFAEEIEETGDEEACRGLGEQFTEILTKRTDNIALFLGLLDEFDFKVRYPTIRLFCNLLENKPRGVQDGVLAVASGVPKLMDLLSDSREVIRNQMLLLLTHITRGNPTLQKIVVFENIYDTLFDIIKEEGYSSGGVVVEDCLELLLTLLKTNAANQTLLREGGFVGHLNSFLTDLLSEEQATPVWPPQKQANVHKMLELVCSLVQPLSSQSEVRASQAAVRNSSLLATLCRLLLASGVPAATLTTTITTIADVIRANADNQKFFSNVMAPSTPPRPAVVVLLMSLVNERQSVSLRCAVLYCLHSLLASNVTLQANLVATLLPQTEQAVEVSSGQLLCGGLFSNDPVSTWLCSVALSHALHDNTDQKEQLLRVQLATGSGGACVSLLQQCCSTLLGASAFLVRAGLLQLLALWLVQCPRAVTQLLAVNTVMPYLTAQISSSEIEDQESQVIQGLCAFVVGACALYNEGAAGTLSRAQLAALVTDRIGAHVFRNKLAALVRTEQFVFASKTHRLTATTKADLCFDHSFVSAYRTLESSLLRAVNIGEAGAGELLEEKVTQLQVQLAAAQEQISSLEGDKHTLTETVQQQQQQHQQQLQQHQQQLQQQHQQLQQQQQQLQQPHTTSQTANGADGGALAAMQQQVSDITYARDYYYYQMLERDKLLQQQQQEQQKAKEQQPQQPQQNGTSSVHTNGLDSPTTPSVEGVVAPDPELETLRCQLQDLQLVLQRKDETLYQLQQQQQSTEQSQRSNVNDNSRQLESLQARLQASEQSRTQLQKENDDLKQQLQQVRKQLHQLQQEQKASSLQQLSVEAADKTNSGSLEEEVKRRKQLETELSSVQAEQEDLLLLLAEQDGRLQRYRSHLTVRGITPPPGEEDDLDEEESENLQ